MCDKVKDYEQDEMAGQVMGTTGSSKVSRADQLEKQAFSFRERAEKAEKAANFLKSHPEFEVFLNLQREGVFELY